MVDGCACVCEGVRERGRLGRGGGVGCGRFYLRAGVTQ